MMSRWIKEKSKKLIVFMLAIIMLFGDARCFLAQENDVVNNTEEIPIIDDVDYSETGEKVYTYENNYVIQSYAMTEEEYSLGMALQKLHLHPNKERHVSVYPHLHSIKDVSVHSVRSYVWNPTVWVKNAIYQNESNWPAVSWEIGQAKTVEASVSTSVGVTDSVVSTTVGNQYTTSHTISTSTTITFTVPYQKEGRVRVKYNRDYITFSCVTDYWSTDMTVQWQEVGDGNALGKPYNIVADLQVRNIS